MADVADIRLVQLARVLGLPRTTAPDVILDAVRQHGDVLAAAFFVEAADNDDVTSTDGARQYLADRLRFFAGIVDDATAADIRARFAHHLKSWES
ncbi:MAG: hypothetical protein R3B97_07280 [Dehalococcoidia bacterium]|nr:hypothetical protein [Dehalococcoidia bacterium]MCB9485704.1 hypothetical protein [Thermoflexaceae bacterium]